MTLVDVPDCQRSPRVQSRVTHQVHSLIGSGGEGGEPTSGGHASASVLADERTPAMDGFDQLALAQHLHSTPHGAVGDLVVGGQVPLAPQPRARSQFARGDAGGDVVSDPKVSEIGITAALGLKITHEQHNSSPDLRRCIR